MQPIQGIHHITAFASDPQRNVDFYHTLLGQRMVKTTINFDDPGTYHFYFADEIGTPGTVMTFFPWPHARRGTPGNGEVAATGYTIRPNSADYWRHRLTENGVTIGTRHMRFGQEVIPFRDPDGMALELIVSDEPATIQPWRGSPIPAEHELRGFHSATLWVDSAEHTAAILLGQFNYTFVGQEGNRYRYKGASNDIGVYIDLLERPGQPRGSQGAGSVHHIAFRTVDDTEQAEYQSQLRLAGYHVTDVKDRQYFHSIYFREPNGVLFEIATDAPGFLYDEPVETLGTTLRLPPWLEQHRETIENAVPKFNHPALATQS
ncbi:MAG: ring-cleaving dioxygenase [Anaerolineae bacterium]|nr:ring-cleaving dioxygenase [Anaerolineae bacterium]